MHKRNTGRQAATARKLGELAIAAPQVVAHRLTRMALAGPVPSARDRKEMSDMVLEKQQAFVSSWTGMWGEMARSQQAMALSWLAPSNLLAPWSTKAMGLHASQLQDAAHRIADKGLGPVHKKAVSNAKRLARTKLK
ncbi:MAG: hypothetical protein KGN16_17150 [Burkholderiales bacterium]|nr:hypothetical protein [Burkholderiales bacterium]